MTVYQVRTKIDSNVAPNQLYYDLSVYRWDKTTNKPYYLVLPVLQKPLQAGHFTGFHKTVDTQDPLNTIYMVQLRLYRKYASRLKLIWKNPFIRMYSLSDIHKDSAYSRRKNGNGRYYETVGKPKSTRLGGNTVGINITSRKQQFEAKEYLAGTLADPFEKNRFYAYAARRSEHSKKVHSWPQATWFQNVNANGYPYPDQEKTSLCGPAAFFFCLLHGSTRCLSTSSS